MTPADAARVLTTAASFDQRTVGEVDAYAWAQALHGLRLEECQRAVVAHYAEHRERVMPADVRALVRVARQDQASRQLEAPQGVPKPPGWPGPEVLAQIQSGAAKHRAVSPSFAGSMQDLAAMAPSAHEPSPQEDQPMSHDEQEVTR